LKKATSTLSTRVNEVIWVF